MEIREYLHGTDHDDILSLWFFRRRMETDVLLELPGVGLIVYNDDHPVAAGFLRMIEDKFAMFDSIITDPDQSAEIRNEALDHLFAALILKAKDIGIKQIFGFTLDTNTIERSIKHGFKKLPYTTAILDL